MADVLEAHVRETDAFTLSLERDPLLRSTIVAVAVFDRAPDWDVLVDRIDRATRLTPTFRQKLVPTPLGLAPPRWLVDGDFDLGWHVRRAGVPADGGMEQILDAARIAGMTAFDHERPLWEFTLYEGLSDGGAALVMKVHHALTDGIGGIQLAAHVVDLERTPADLGPAPEPPTVPDRSPFEHVLEAIGFDLRRLAVDVVSAARMLPSTVLGAVRDPLGAVRDVADTAASVGRFVRPISDTRSPVMTDRRLQWRYDTLDVPMAPLRAAAKTVGGTLNDGFVGGITGGLRRYHERHDAPVDTLRLTMPISIRTDDDVEGGNRVTLVRFEVPVGIEDPAARMTAIDELCGDLRRERAIPHSNTIAGVLNLLPVAVTGGMLKHVDFLASNVPGFDGDIYVGGARVEAFYPFGPTLGSAANITLMSYRGVCHIGINTDTAAVPDTDVFIECLREGFEEVLALARG